ncbi:hypothetical protein N7541_006676 [Penicillium brevicompactum]|uniref:Myb-like domain-containing protein n=1 Tax=Penicillium brevicompactum TaxID=5074 RepID=A0A9W9R5H5_PENBR|nr:hypothetical protein N7541_006676 [Penicillium brevicompactum]
MSDTAEIESDPGYSPSTPSERSVSPDIQPSKPPSKSPTTKTPRKSSANTTTKPPNIPKLPNPIELPKTKLPPLINDGKADNVDRQVGEALMRRSPQMPGSLLFMRTYTHLLAESKKEIDHTWSRHQEDVFQVSQHGSVVWTSTEKEAFFNALDRKGKGDIKELAASIGTKSELEVMEYISLMHRALEIQFRSGSADSMPVLGDIPAAKEISQKGCEMLDDYADVLVLTESLTQAKAGKQDYGDFWNITGPAALELVNAVDDENDNTVRGDLHLAATLLYLPDWIQLSRRLFMNFGGKKTEDHWTNIASSKKNITAHDQTPSMAAESAIDFYALTVSVTRRLVQSAIFFSMSRRRGSTRKGSNRKPLIRVSDVRAAIEVLNMKHRRPNFVDTARRNELQIADIHNRKGWVPTPFSYEEAETIIRKRKWSRYRSNAAISSGADQDNEEADNVIEIEDSDDELEAEGAEGAESQSKFETEVVDLDPSSSREGSPGSGSEISSDAEELEMDDEEKHADAADEAASRLEEAKFLQLMDKSGEYVAEPLKEEDPDHQLSEYPEHRIREPVFDWRSRVPYQSEWEEYKHDFAGLKEEFEMPPRKRLKPQESEL